MPLLPKPGVNMAAGWRAVGHLMHREHSRSPLSSRLVGTTLVQPAAAF